MTIKQIVPLKNKKCCSVNLLDRIKNSAEGNL